MPLPSPLDLLVLGGGPAGIQASKLVKAQRPEWRVVMLRPEPASMVYCAIPYVLEGIVPAEATLKRDALVTDAGVELVRQAAVAVDVAAREVRTDAGETLRFERLLIVTGALPIMPPVSGSDLGGIIRVKTEASMRQLLDRLEGGARRAVVVGAGAIGIEQALAFRERGLDVHLVDRASRILPHLMDGDMSAEAQALLEQAGVVLHLANGLSGFEGATEVSGVRLAGGEVLPLEPGRDICVVAVGMKPDVSLVEGQLDIVSDGIVVDSRLRTTVPGVFAAGDCVSTISAIDGKPLSGKLATNAVPMAKVAAATICGLDADYPGIINGSVTTVGELRLGGTGFTEEFATARGYTVVTATAELTSRFPMMPGARPLRVKLVAHAPSGRVLGGQVAGYEAVAERVDLITLAIQHGLTVADLAGLSYSAQPWQTFFPANNPIVAAASKLRAVLPECTARRCAYVEPC